MLDAERQIRFLYPPVFFVASLCLGLRLDSNTSLSDVVWILVGESLRDKLWAGQGGATVVTAAVASGLVVMIAAGYLLSSITVLLLRIGFGVLDGRPYEACLSPEAYRLIREHLKPKPAKHDAGFTLL